MTGLAAVGMGFYVVAPNLILSALSLLLMAACPLLMLLMMNAIQGLNSTVRDEPFDSDAAERRKQNNMFSRDEQFT